MEQIKDIQIIRLVAGYFLLILPVLVFLYYRTGLVKDTLVAIARMTLQLLLVAVYLDVIFRINQAWINLLWVLIMLMVAAYTTVRRSNLPHKYFLLPVFVSTLISVVVIDAFFLGFLIRLDYFFEARYFIPITGILMGNTLRINIIGLSSFYDQLKKELNLYRFFIANGATRSEGLRHFMRHALRMAFNPLIATISIIGLISLPGVMTGQILGGSDPVIAIKYQVMFMISILVSSLITVVLTIWFANRYVFDRNDNPVHIL